ncbi:hypothetical protein BGZ81_004196 [Podila clonocystis]|nr:hypothetical protein BGZ81_004196 [Podila clonocystis]
MDSMNTPPPSPESQELAELLDIIDSANRPLTSSIAADALIKFMKNNKARADIELSPRNLAIALKRSYNNCLWAEKRLNAGYQYLLDSICSLALACVNHISTLSEEDITRMLQEPVFIALASVVFDTIAFKHKDRQKSQAHKDWIFKILELARTFVTVVFSSIISLLCRGVHKAIDTAMEATAQNSGPMPVKTALALTRFYAAQLPTVVKLLGSELAREDEESIECMNMVKITLSSLRSRVLSNRILRRDHRTMLHDTTKTICNMEEQIVASLIGCTEITDDERYRLLCRLTSTSGSKSVLGALSPLSDKEWNLGRLYIALGILAAMDEFSPALQLQIYPVENTTDPSILLTLLKCIKALGLPEFVPAFDTDAGSEDDDTYLAVLSSLCVFAHLVQSQQFVKLQIDMTGLVLGRSELESSLGRDWWVCMSKELGQEFTVRQVFTLLELLESFPVSQASRTLASLMGNLIRNLNAASQARIVLHIGLKLKEDSPTLLACFPFPCLSTQSLDELVIHCSEQWGIACDLMAADRLVVDAFYSSYRYIACIHVAMSGHSQHSEAVETWKPKMLDWSRTQICGAPELLALVLNNRTDANKVLYTVTHILSFLAVLQPLSANDIIQVLDACVRLYDYQGDVPVELFIVNFLESCSAIQVTESEELAWVNTLMPDLVPRYVSKSMQQKSRIYREVENGKRINVRDPEHLWQAMDSRLKLLQFQQQHSSASTVRDLQRATGTAVSPDECLAAIATAKRKLQALYDDNKGLSASSTVSPALKSAVTAELLQLQRYTDDGSMGSTAMV